LRMLGAEVASLSKQIILNTLEIRQKELDFYTGNMNALITSSSILFGLASAGVGTFCVNPPTCVPTDTAPIPRAIFFVSLTVAVSIEFLCLVVAIFTVVMAPGLALRGPHGSMDKAVDGIRKLAWVLLVFFLGGLAFFQLAMIAFAWIITVDDTEVAVVLTLEITGGTLFTAIMCRKVYQYFYYDSEKTATHGITNAASDFAKTNEAGGPGNQPAPVSVPTNSMMIASEPASKPKKKGMFS